MTVLFFSRLFYPHIGGVETHVYSLSKELIRKGHTVVVVTEQYESRLFDEEMYEDIIIYRIPINKNIKKSVWQWLWQHRYLIIGADIIHAHDVGFWYFPFRLLFFWKKFYITFHGYEIQVPPAKKAIAIRKLTEFLSNGSIIVGEYIRRWYYANPDFVLYGGINRFRIQDSGFKKKTNPKILFIGRIEEDNGVKIYAQALKLLKQKKIPFVFEAIGDGAMRKVLEPFGKVHGFVENTIKYIQDADIIFASSYLSILESAVHKKPVVAVYTNELKKDYLQLTPFAKEIVISDNAGEISSLIQKNKLSGYSLEFNKWIQKQTWQNIAQIYIKLWEK